MVTTERAQSALWYLTHWWFGRVSGENIGVILGFVDSVFRCFCPPGEGDQRPSTCAGDTEELRPSASGHAPPDPLRCVRDHLLLPVSSVTVSD